MFNPALNENVPGARIALVEKHINVFGHTECKEIDSKVTDENGECFFDHEKLKKAGRYEYYCAVKESWGLKQYYPCGGKTSGFVKKGKTQDWLLTDQVHDAFFKVQYNNLLNPSQPGDSLLVSVNIGMFYDPILEHNQGGGGVFFSSPYYGCNGFPFSSTVITSPVKTINGLQIIRIRKRKMGIVSESTESVKVYPNQTTTIPINW